MKIKDINPGDRFLYRGIALSISEAICVEFSPGRKLVKLKYPSGGVLWLDEYDTANLDIIDRLPNRKPWIGGLPAIPAFEPFLKDTHSAPLR